MQVPHCAQTGAGSCPSAIRRDAHLLQLFGCDPNRTVQWNAGTCKQCGEQSLGRKEIRDFIDWIYQRAMEQEGTNAGCTTSGDGCPLSSLDVARLQRVMKAWPPLLETLKVAIKAISNQIEEYSAMH
jgi:hypothetical protein